MSVKFETYIIFSILDPRIEIDAERFVAVTATTILDRLNTFALLSKHTQSPILNLFFELESQRLAANTHFLACVDKADWWPVQLKWIEYFQRLGRPLLNVVHAKHTHKISDDTKCLRESTTKNSQQKE